MPNDLLVVAGEASGDQHGAELVRELRGESPLRPLAERPLLLTMIADLHASGVLRLSCPICPFCEIF